MQWPGDEISLQGGEATVCPAMAYSSEATFGAMGLDWPMACRISALLEGGIITYSGAVCVSVMCVCPL